MRTFFVDWLYKGNRFLGRLWVNVGKKVYFTLLSWCRWMLPRANLGEKNLSEKNNKRIFAHNVIPVSEMDLVMWTMFVICGLLYLYQQLSVWANHFLVWWSVSSMSCQQSLCWWLYMLWGCLLMHSCLMSSWFPPILCYPLCSPAIGCWSLRW